MQKYGEPKAELVSLGLLWLRVMTSILLFWTNGWPKIVNYGSELQHIDDPLGLGRWLTLWLSLFAEVACPAAVAVGLLTRLAAVPILILLLVAMLLVHAEWTLEKGQFGWLYVIVYIALMITGAGRYSLDQRLLEQR